MIPSTNLNALRILTWLLQLPRARILPFPGQEAEHFRYDITNYTKGNAMGNVECHSLGTVPMAAHWPIHTETCPWPFMNCRLLTVPGSPA